MDESSPNVHKDHEIIFFKNAFWISEDSKQDIFEDSREFSEDFQRFQRSPDFENIRRTRKVNEYNDTTRKLVAGLDILINYSPR